MVVSKPLKPSRWAVAMARAALHFMSASGRWSARSHNSFAPVGKVYSVRGFGNAGRRYIGESISLSKLSSTPRQRDGIRRWQGDRRNKKVRHWPIEGAIVVYLMRSLLLIVTFSSRHQYSFRL